MPYEIDFIGIKKDDISASKNLKDADAICLRWKNTDGSYTVGVVDGGFENHGKALVQHMNRYYFNDLYNCKTAKEKVVDFMVVTHPDQDHTIGLKQVLENFTVKKIYMNMPWTYVNELYDKVNDGRITKASLEARLRAKYKPISDIEKQANEQGVPIYVALQGTSIDGRLLILSPSKEFYLQLLVESNKTPLIEDSLYNQLGESVRRFTEAAKSYVYSLYESWHSELLREDVKTTAENETSVVLFGSMGEEGMFLTGDAGIRALSNAMDYMEICGIDIQTDVSFYQMPHHGGRHNVSPSVLDRMLGEVVSEGETRNKMAFASVAAGSDHPLKMVTNGYIRRGVKTYKTDGSIIHHHRGNVPDRGWERLSAIEFSNKVEDWDD